MTSFQCYIFTQVDLVDLQDQRAKEDSVKFRFLLQYGGEYIGQQVSCFTLLTVCDNTNGSIVRYQNCTTTDNKTEATEHITVRTINSKVNRLSVI